MQVFLELGQSLLLLGRDPEHKVISHPARRRLAGWPAFKSGSRFACSAWQPCILCHSCGHDEASSAAGRGWSNRQSCQTGTTVVSPQTSDTVCVRTNVDKRGVCDTPLGIGHTNTSSCFTSQSGSARRLLVSFECSWLPTWLHECLIKQARSQPSREASCQQLLLLWNFVWLLPAITDSISSPENYSRVHQTTSRKSFKVAHDNIKSQVQGACITRLSQYEYIYAQYIHVYVIYYITPCCDVM